MKERKIPMRTCAVTREKFPKKELLRVVRTPEGEFLVDLIGKQNGRGVYLKKDKDVFEKAKQKKVFNKVFETEVPDTLYEELLKLEL